MKRIALTLLLLLSSAGSVLAQVGAVGFPIQPWNSQAEYVYGAQVTYNGLMYQSIVNKDIGYTPATTINVDWSSLGGPEGEQTIAYAANEVYSPSYAVVHAAVAGNVSFALGAGYPGQPYCIVFIHDTTSGSYVITPPSNVKGFFGSGTLTMATPYTTASGTAGRAQQCFTYSVAEAAWLPQSSGITNF